MKTAINGKVRLRFFWGSMYSSGGMTPIERIWRLGRLTLAKVVYASEQPFSYYYYRKDVMQELHEVYDVRWESCHDDKMWHSVYSRVDGGYVGRPEDAYRLLQQGLRSIQKSRSEDKVCSIGYNPSEIKWYGWSHRAMYGFGIGDVVKKGDCCASSGYTEEYLKEHPEEDRSLPVGFVAKSMVDAMKMAIAFAESVS